MDAIKYIKEVHDTLLSAGIDAKLSFSGKGAEIKTPFGSAKIEWTEGEKLKATRSLSLLSFGVHAMQLLTKANESRRDYLADLADQAVKDNQKQD